MMVPGAIKNRPKIALADYEALPESMRGLYQGSEYPEFIGRKMMKKENVSHCHLA